MCTGKFLLFRYSICLSSFILFWMFEILSTVLLNLNYGSRTVASALSLVCFTSVLYHDKILSPVKFDFVPLNS